jgi:hypothetical protein
MSASEDGRTSTEWVTHLDPVSVGTEQWGEVMDLVAPLLGMTTWNRSEDRMVSLNQIAKVAGVAKGTPIQWRQRTLRGELEGVKAFPDPDDPDTFPDKPMWLLSTVVNHLIANRKWPPGAAGRPAARGARGAKAPHRVEAELVR